jgi:uncharacterized protein YdeI (BOF family)
MKARRVLILILTGSSLALMGSMATQINAQSTTPQPTPNSPTSMGELAQASSQSPTTRISDLRRTNSIAISGRVVSVVGNDFTLNDDSGQIIVDAGPRWYREVNLSQGEQVTVTGKLSEKSGEFDAFSIQRANGSVIEIRPVEGPPPWAGGSRSQSPKR